MSIEKYKLKYDTTNGKIIYMGSGDPSPAEMNEAIEDFVGQHPGELEFFTRTGPGQITRKTQPEINEIKRKRGMTPASKFIARYNALPNDTAKNQFLVNVIARLIGSIPEGEFDNL